MATEISGDGYADLRRVINSSVNAPDQWDYISIRNDSGAEIMRVSITGDSRAGWNTSDPAATAQECEITLTGSDPEITLPETIGGSALYTDSSGGEARHIDDTMTNATLESESDEIVVTHTIEGPL